MLFMVIERFRDNDMIPVYERLRDRGRQLPEGLKYLDSWVEPNFPDPRSGCATPRQAMSRSGRSAA